MPGEQYYALARAIKRPMRRWWLTVGIWWLGGAAVLLIVFAIMTAYESRLQFVGHTAHIARPVYNRPIWYQILETLIWFMDYIVLALALLSCQKVAALVSELTYSTPMQGTGNTSALTFRLALFNCWPALIPVVLWKMVFKFSIFTGDMGGLTNTLLGFTRGIDQASTYAILLLWIFALAVLPHAPNWISWVFFLFVIVLVTPYKFVVNMFADWRTFCPSYLLIGGLFVQVISRLT